MIGPIYRLTGGLPIFMMTSFARSGETLMLRSLGAHPDVIVLHQILFHDHEQDRRIFKRIRRRRSRSILPPYGFIQRKGGGRLLLVKHGVWIHAWPHRGFVLARNPFAVVASHHRYSLERGETEQQQRDRIVRWAKRISPSLLPVCQLGSLTEAISKLYYAKMQAALSTGLPVFRYEDFVQKPKTVLAEVCGVLGVEWSDETLRSERSFAPGEIGHGGIDLSAPIRPTPVYGSGLSTEQFAIVETVTAPLLLRFGYHVREGIVTAPAMDQPPEVHGR